MSEQDLLTPEQIKLIDTAYEKLLSDNNLKPDHYRRNVTLEFVNTDHVNNEMTIIVEALPLPYKFRAIAGKFNFNQIS